MDRTLLAFAQTSGPLVMNARTSIVTAESELGPESLCMYELVAFRDAADVR